MTKSIDLNCDMGESFGAWTMGCDEELMNYVSSINIACGFHAGDPSTIRKTVELAIMKNVAIGAHPSYPDLQGFGRRDMSLSPEEVHDVVLYQVAALKGIAEALGGRLNHVKPHGALYNHAAKSAEIASAIAKAVVSIDPTLVLYSLSGSKLVKEGEQHGLRTASEVFADRTYQSDGSLTPRAMPNALISEIDAAVSHVIGMIESQTVRSTTGEHVPIRAETLCIHGDGPNAVSFARMIRYELTAKGIDVHPVSPKDR